MPSLFANACRLYARHFGVIAGLVLAIGLPCEGLLNYLNFRVFAPDDVAASLQAALILQCVFSIVMTGGILHALFVGKLERRAGFPECLSSGVTHWPMLVWTNFLVFAAVFLGTLAFIVPGIYLLIRLCLANTVVVSEGTWGIDALRRSSELTGRHFWKIITVGITIYLPLQVVAMLAAKMALTVPELNQWPVATAIGVILEFLSAFITVCTFCLYEQFLAREGSEP